MGEEVKWERPRTHASQVLRIGKARESATMLEESVQSTHYGWLDWRNHRGLWDLLQSCNGQGPAITSVEATARCVPRMSLLCPSGLWPRDKVSSILGAGRRFMELKAETAYFLFTSFLDTARLVGGHSQPRQGTTSSSPGSQQSAASLIKRPDLLYSTETIVVHSQGACISV